MKKESTISCLKELIKVHDDICEFGTTLDAVKPVWFDKAENTLGFKLTDSYTWFLKNYAF